jgi:uncharacterized protein (DUF433 family)
MSGNSHDKDAQHQESTLDFRKEIRKMASSIIVSNPAILSGEPVFRGTRVPFRSLTDYLEHGRTLSGVSGRFPQCNPRRSYCGDRRSQNELDCHLEMKLLFDECVPRKIKFLFADGGHECETVRDAGFSGKENGEPLALALRPRPPVITLNI